MCKRVMKLVAVLAGVGLLSVGTALAQNRWPEQGWPMRYTWQGQRYDNNVSYPGSDFPVPDLGYQSNAYDIGPVYFEGSPASQPVYYGGFQPGIRNQGQPIYNMNQSAGYANEPVNTFDQAGTFMNQNVAGIRVFVRPDAQIRIDGNTMQQMGNVREFISPPIQPGTYTYQLQAFWFDQNRGPVRESRTVTVHPGQLSTVNFTQ